MYFGHIKNFDAQKKFLPTALVKAVQETLGHDLHALKAGRYELSSVADSFFLVQDLTAKKFDDARVEAHRQYIDVQYLLKGRERFGAAHIDPDLKPAEDLMAEKDVSFYPTPEGEFLIDLKPGEYAIFYPFERHRPCCAAGDDLAIRKVVIKIPQKEI